jgi:predicted deacetylase
MKLLFAMHDATPFHLERMRRAEELFAAWGVQQATYLLVPDYHGQARSDRSPEFLRWCHRQRPFEVHWCLHGYYHLHMREPGDSTPGRLRQTADRLWHGRFDEGEFRDLPNAAVMSRLERGRDIYEQCLGSEPRGFIAPKWAQSQHVQPALRSLGFAWNEDDRQVYHYPTGRMLPAPVITWATRTLARKYVSIYGCPMLLRRYSDVPLLRIAVHPFDFDHRQTIATIAHVVTSAVAVREQLAYDERLFGDGDGTSGERIDRTRRRAVAN